jgi:hypothetical protein
MRIQIKPVEKKVSLHLSEQKRLLYKPVAFSISLPQLRQRHCFLSAKFATRLISSVVRTAICFHLKLMVARKGI